MRISVRQGYPLYVLRLMPSGKIVRLLVMLVALALPAFVYTVGQAEAVKQYNFIVVPIDMAEATEARVKWAVAPYMEPDKVTKKSVWHTITPLEEGASAKEIEHVVFSFPYLPEHDVEIRRRLGHPEGTLNPPPDGTTASKSLMRSHHPHQQNGVTVQM